MFNNTITIFIFFLNFSIKKYKIMNIHECYKYNNCTSIKNDDSRIQDVILMINDGQTSSISFQRMTFDNINGGKIMN